MQRGLRSYVMRCLAFGIVGLAVPLCLVPAQEKALVPAGSAVNITIVPGATPAPPVSITLIERHAHVTPIKGKMTHTGGGLIDVASPAPDTVLITMTGAVVANSEMKFELDQVFEIGFDDPKVKRAKVLVEGRVIGLLRGEKKGCAEYGDACATIACGPTELVTVCVPSQKICGCDSLSVNDHDGPKSALALAAKYTLHQTFRIAAQSDSVLCKHPSAEFAPDPAIDPLWISYHEPFHGVKKDTFGFQTQVKVVPDTGEPVPPPVEKKPLPTAQPPR